MQVHELNNAIAIAAGGYHSMAIVRPGGPPVVDSPSVAAEPSAEGSPAVASAVFTDPDGNEGPFTCTVNYGDGSGDQLGAISGATCTGPAHTYADNGSYIVSVSVTDTDGERGAGTTTHAVHNVAPAITEMTGAADPLALAAGAVVASVTATFTDRGSADTHMCTFAWDDGQPDTPISAAGAGDGSCTTTHTYTTAGVYTVRVTVADDDGGTASASQFVVVYDPSAGFVTGSGAITSPPGAYAAAPALTGPAEFGFVAKYKKGATVPTGDTAFAFQLANFSFSSTSYQWLVVAGARAQFKGAGTVNGIPGYSFLLTATDGRITGGGGVDTFRIKIREIASGAVIYDNVRGMSDDLDAANPQAISNGNIMIHTR